MEEKTNLEGVPTCELCHELEKRQGVSYTTLNPDGTATVKVEGPAIVYVITD